MIRVFICALWVFLAQAHAQILVVGVGSGSPGSGYVGPGDVISGADAWWGLRCYNNAYSGNVADVWDAATGNTTETLLTCSAGVINQTVHTLATTCASACVISTFYDQSGHGINLTQSTNANRFTLTLNCIRTLMCATAVGSSSQCYVGSGTFTQAQPFMTVYVADRNGATSSYGTVLSDSGDTTESGFYPSVNEIYIGNTANTPFGSLIFDNQWHVIQNSFNGASSKIVADSGFASGALSPGTAGPSAKFPVLGAFGAAGPSCGGQYFTGLFVEGGYWSGTFTSTQLANLNQNISKYWFGVQSVLDDNTTILASGSSSNPTTAAAPAGSLIVASILIQQPNSGAQTVTSLVDSAGNSYTKVVESTSAGSFFSTSLWECVGCPNTLPVGGTFTAVTSNNSNWAIEAAVVFTSNGATDATNTTTGSGITTYSLSTGTLTATDAIFGSSNFNGAPSAYTEATGFTILSKNTTSGILSYKFASTNTTWNPSWTGSDNITAVIGAFKF